MADEAEPPPTDRQIRIAAYQRGHADATAEANAELNALRPIVAAARAWGAARQAKYEAMSADMEMQWRRSWERAPFQREAAAASEAFSNAQRALVAAIDGSAALGTEGDAPDE